MTYDHQGNRVKYQTVGTTTTYYPNSLYDVTSTTTQDKHIYANNLLLATVHATGTATSTYYVHTDQLGGSTLITDSSGNLNELNDYFPFGEVRTDQKQTDYTESKKYTGHEYDKESSLNYMGARYQDDRSGRFASEDPSFLAIGDDAQLKNITGKGLYENLSDPQSLNSYSYVINNPYRYTDPTGNQLVETLGVIYLVYGGLQLSVDSYTAKLQFFDYPEQFSNRDKLDTGVKIALDLSLNRVGSSLNKAGELLLNTTLASLDAVDHYAGGRIYNSSNKGYGDLDIDLNKSSRTKINLEQFNQSINVPQPRSYSSGNGSNYNNYVVTQPNVSSQTYTNQDTQHVLSNISSVLSQLSRVLGINNRR